MKNNPTERSPSIKILSLVAVLFGLMTIFAGGMVLFGGEAAQQLAGDIVSFVVLYNFLAGFVYLLAGIGFWNYQRWAIRLAFFIVAANIIVSLFLGEHILGGGAYELRTVAAMSFRTLLWLVIAFLAARNIRNIQISAESH